MYSRPEALAPKNCGVKIKSTTSTSREVYISAGGTSPDLSELLRSIRSGGFGNFSTSSSATFKYSLGCDKCPFAATINVEKINPNDARQTADREFQRLMDENCPLRQVQRIIP